MKLVCSREALLHAFLAASQAVKAQSTKPILRNVKLEAREGEIALLGTDMEIGIRASIPCDEVQTPGQVVLPAERMGQLLRANMDSTLTIESIQNRVEIHGERSEFKFTTEDPGEFPTVPTFTPKYFLKTPARYIREAIRRTTFAADNDSGRYAMGGIYLDYFDGKLHFVATDGRRLATQAIPMTPSEGYPQENVAIATAVSMNILEKLLSPLDEDVMLGWEEGRFVMQAEHLFYYATLMEGRYPDWKLGMAQVDHPTMEMDLVVQPFSQALFQAGIMAEKVNPGVVLEFKTGKMIAHAANAEFGESRIELPIPYEGTSLELKLNQTYVIDFLRRLDPETTISLKMVDAKTGVLFLNGEDYRYLVMPMQHDTPQPPTSE
ncbi:MAG: DNA polymerase III subunit beta [Planctomycetia bacterium]|nr:DNA polymerase III subunit beta [Planctomycetia bacterium]